jgi:hypothetical protein
MAKEKKVEKPATIIPMLKSDLIGILLLGAAAGLVVLGLGIVFNRFIFDVYFCQGDVTTECTNARNYSAAIASVIAAIAAMGGLVRLRVYRPLLVVIASMVSLWGVVQVVWSLYWLIAVLVVAVLYALAFGLYSWVARIREFWISLLVIIVLVVAVRVALLA